LLIRPVHVIKHRTPIAFLFFSFVLPSIEGLVLAPYGFSTAGLFAVLILTCSVPNLIILYTPNESSRTKRQP
jgi:hypothetical protein